MPARQPITAAIGVFAVLEALKDHATSPAKASAVATKAQRSDDFTRRALLTLKQAGWAIETERGWLLSVKAGQFSEHWVTLAASLNAPIQCPHCSQVFIRQMASGDSSRSDV